MAGSQAALNKRQQKEREAKHSSLCSLRFLLFILSQKELIQE